jgi:DNA polymerase I-like protein with 3'-5' exonuclease and polymerase domains
MSKVAGHGSNYGGTARTLGRQMKVEEKFLTVFQAKYMGGEIPQKSLLRWDMRDVISEGERVKDMVVFEGAFPGIRDWHDEVRHELQTTGVLTTPLGRKRQFWGRLNDDATFRKALAYVPQSTIGDLLNMGLWHVWNQLDPHDLQILGQGHDAIVAQVREDDFDRVVSRVQELMTIPIPVRGRQMVVPVEMVAGQNWRDHDEDINPNGMRKI